MSGRRQCGSCLSRDEEKGDDDKLRKVERNYKRFGEWDSEKGDEKAEEGREEKKGIGKRKGRKDEREWKDKRKKESVSRGGRKGGLND